MKTESNYTNHETKTDYVLGAIQQPSLVNINKTRKDVNSRIQVMECETRVTTKDVKKCVNLVQLPQLPLQICEGSYFNQISISLLNRDISTLPPEYDNPIYNILIIFSCHPCFTFHHLYSRSVYISFSFLVSVHIH